ncbi:MAG: excinuclease ABC subunit UvrA [Clostridia bacterium]|nr:excinuclease ABC subunit UvrA [Clostridia bacterium]
MDKFIHIKGARVNNLKDIELSIPRDKLVVFTGLSGSGKSSLAFDTLFAEGQRRYMESLSSYARQFLGQMDKPDVDYIDGLSPAISIDQKTTSKNPRSTVGTITEIYDYLRLLYARVGTPHCPNCGKEISQQTVDQIYDKICEYPIGSKLMILAPVARGKKGEYTKLLQSFKKNGYARAKIDGEIVSLDQDIKLEKNIKHNISIVVDRLVVKEDMGSRLADSIENAIKISDGIVVVDCDGVENIFSTKYACPDCEISLEEMTPRSFSFNSPFGACPECLGLGFKNEFAPELLIRDPKKSVNEGVVRVSGWNMEMGTITDGLFRALAKHYSFSLDTPFEDLPERIQNILLYGNNGEEIEAVYTSKLRQTTYRTSFEGVIPNLMRRYNDTQSEYVKNELSKFFHVKPCSCCGGKRLKKEVLAVTVGGKNIHEFCDMPVLNSLQFAENLSLTDTQMLIARQILKEINARLNFLKDVGLGYLTLTRSSATLSGGEAQRIRLATQIGSGLTGILYILDEPSIGLHQRDNDKLIATLKKLRDLGNTLIVVEHDEDTIKSADYVVDIGPRAGIHGGELVIAGTVDEVIANPNSITGQYLSGKKYIPVPTTRRAPDGRYLRVKGASQNNLKNIDVDIPVGLLNVVTGVSGSGKSSLVNGILYPMLATKLNNNRTLIEGKCDGIEGIEHFDKVIEIDQSPIGRTPRSNPATYTGVFTAIRELFASTIDAKAKGYNMGRFSFNVSGGRCEHCAGDGVKKIEMHFLSDVYVPCEVCKGKRYNRETLEVRYKGKNIYEVLEMTIDEACEFFENIPSIYSKIKTLRDIGLGYIKLGQPATTLSGGEAQRVKLATELSKRSTGKTIYILDEPTTGLHTDDVAKLIDMLQRLVSSGNTAVVIEHNLDVVKVADYIIDLGPEGGEGGGRIIATGSPEEVVKNQSSFTGIYLKTKLEEHL